MSTFYKYFSTFFENLNINGKKELSENLSEKLKLKIPNFNSGHLPKWDKILNSLPNIKSDAINLKSDTILISSKSQINSKMQESIYRSFLELHPWRKGPFTVFGKHIDSEWRSDLKWNRIVESLTKCNIDTVLDIGSGNGYFGLKLKGIGAKNIVCIDHFLLYTYQFLALNHFMENIDVSVLPLKLEDCAKLHNEFDLIFSMGVMYHRKQTQMHPAEIFPLLSNGGSAIIETLIIDSKADEILIPEGRYASMRNVYGIPSIKLLLKWIKNAGFTKAEVVDISKTTVEEQRSTDWMKFKSLSSFLDPLDSSKTIEGYPAPIRAAILVSK